MNASEAFGKWLRERRTELGFTQQQLARKMFVSTALVSYWENGRRTPDVAALARLAELLGVTDADLLSLIQGTESVVSIILVDDEKIILEGGLRTLNETLPQAQIRGFGTMDSALRHARENPVDVAFIDIELRGGSGLTLAEELSRINPRVNIIFLTSYREYALSAWEMGASGYVLKPLTADRVRQEMKALRYPLRAVKP